MSTTNGGAAVTMSDSERWQSEQLVRLRGELDKRKNQVQALIPGGMLTVAKAFSSALLACRKSDGLLKCNMDSIITAVMDATSLGLSVHFGPLGEAALVPFHGLCTLQIGYRGMIKLMIAGGAVQSVHADVVYRQDRWEYSVSHKGVRFLHEPDEEFEHQIPSRDDPFPDVAHFYAVAFPHRRTGGSPLLARLSLAKAMRIRNQTLTRTPQSPHGEWPIEMAIKGAIRQLDKRVPKTELGEQAEIIEGKYQEIIEKNAGLNLVSGKFDAPALPDPKTRPQETIEVTIEQEAAPIGAAVEQEEGAQRQQPAPPGKPSSSPQPERGAARTDASPLEAGKVSPAPVAFSGSPYERMTALFAKPGPVSASAFGAIYRTLDPAHRDEWQRKYNERNKRGGQR